MLLWRLTYLALRQAQQLAWHQYDFIFFTIVSLTAFIWAITVLARAASGTLQGGSFLVAICSAYIALAGWTVLRCSLNRATIYTICFWFVSHRKLAVRRPNLRSVCMDTLRTHMFGCPMGAHLVLSVFCPLLQAGDRNAQAFCRAEAPTRAEIPLPAGLHGAR